MIPVGTKVRINTGASAWDGKFGTVETAEDRPGGWGTYSVRSGPYAICSFFESELTPLDETAKEPV